VFTGVSVGLATTTGVSLAWTERVVGVDNSARLFVAIGTLQEESAKTLINTETVRIMANRFGLIIDAILSDPVFGIAQAGCV
jgi:hypothetical protein